MVVVIHILQKIFGYNNFPTINIFRNYTKKVVTNDLATKTVPRKSVEDASNLVWRDPNFELLASNGFPLFLRGNIGLAWYDSQTTIKTGDELVMEQIDDVNDVNHQNMICHIQSCPTVLRKTVADLFPNHTVEDHSVLSVITITLKPNIKRMRTNKELETEKIAQTFLIAAQNICGKLKNSGYWADFINPFSGLPYFSPTPLSALYAADQKFRCMDFQIFYIKDCRIICNEGHSGKKFIGSLFTSAPCKKKYLNVIFT